jgi:hypothetical protein
MNEGRNESISWTEIEAVLSPLYTDIGRLDPGISGTLVLAQQDSARDYISSSATDAAPFFRTPADSFFAASRPKAARFCPG